MAQCFSADTSGLPAEKCDFPFCMPRAAACVSRSSDIGTSRYLPLSDSLRYVKESDFRARRENAFLTLITLLQDPMSCWEMNFPTGTLFKEFRCTVLWWSVGPVKIDWNNCEYRLTDFLFGYLPNVDRSLNGHLPSATHHGAFLRPYICAEFLTRFMAFSVAALKHDWVPKLMHTLTAFSPTEWAFVSRLYLEEFGREQIL